MDGAAIRPATADDAATLAALNRHVQDLHVAAEPSWFRPTEPAAAETWFASALADDRLTAAIAEVDGRPVGYVLAEWALRPAGPFTRERRSLLVHHLAVAPDQRRRGVGRGLLAWAEERAAAAGLATVELDTWDFNADARRFFAACGYEPWSVRLCRRLEGASTVGRAAAYLQEDRRHPSRGRR